MKARSARQFFMNICLFVAQARSARQFFMKNHFLVRIRPEKSPFGANPSRKNTFWSRSLRFWTFWGVFCRIGRLRRAWLGSCPFVHGTRATAAMYREAGNTWICQMLEIYGLAKCWKHMNWAKCRKPMSWAKCRKHMLGQMLEIYRLAQNNM